MNSVQQNLITELGLQDLPEDQQQQIITQMTEAVLKRIAVNVLERLSEADRDQFEQLQENGTPEEMEQFLHDKIDNYEELVQQTVAEFKDEMKQSMEELRESFKQEN